MNTRTIPDRIVLTHQAIEAGSTKGAGWTKAQLAVLGVTHRTGWKKLVLGTVISRDLYLKFLALNRNWDGSLPALIPA